MLDQLYNCYTSWVEQPYHTLKSIHRAIYVHHSDVGQLIRHSQFWKKKKTEKKTSIEQPIEPSLLPDDILSKRKENDENEDWSKKL